MRALPLLLLLCLLSVAPAYGQPVPPTATPPSLGTLAREVQQTGEVLTGVQDSIGANSLVFIIGAALLALVIWFGVRPSMNNVSKTQQSLQTAQSDLALAHRDGVEVQRQLLAYLRNNDKIVERNTEAYEGVKASFDASTEAYGSLAKSVHDTWTKMLIQLAKDREARGKADMATQEQIKQINERLDSVTQMVKDIQSAIAPGSGYRQALDRVIQALENTKLKDTGELPPLDTITKEDPGKSSIWNTDNPPDV
jgi:hypothetical protein